VHAGKPNRFFFVAPNVPLHPPHYSNTHSLMTTGSSCD